MSCNCHSQSGSGFACTCDDFLHPPILEIGAGLHSIPRQIAGFPEFRRAMLRQLRSQKLTLLNQDNELRTVIPLEAWHARDTNDPGIMLIEMWAYISDSLSFYDQVIANEAYVRTSIRRPSLRRLIALLGYLPRPAIGSQVHLAAFADGRLPISLPTSTSFRSGAFNGNPPQVFELEEPATIHPFNNRWKIDTPHAGTVNEMAPDTLLIQATREIKMGDFLLLTHQIQLQRNQVLTVKRMNIHLGNDGKKYQQIQFTEPTKLVATNLLKRLMLWAPTQQAGLWVLNATYPSVENNRLTLASKVTELQAGHKIFVRNGFTGRWFVVTAVAEVQREAMPTSTITINGSNFKIPGATTTVTQITLDVSLNSALRKQAGETDWTQAHATQLTVFYGLQPTALCVDEPKQFVTQSDLFSIAGIVEPVEPNFASSRFLLQDKNTAGRLVEGSIQVAERRLAISASEGWATPLSPPISAMGNVLTASRGETVLGEILGSGDGSKANQTFKLKKKPLTYLLGNDPATGNGYRSTLSIWVNGIQWKEARSFFGKTPDDRVYIVRQTDDGDTQVSFGDGIRGQRLPSGTDNIVANYRFGAGAAVPPGGAVNQIGKPVKGLQKVKNVEAAFGGADAETSAEIRTNAPKSALILGRIVSLQDMEAVARSFSGVEAVKTEWRWNRSRQTAMAHLYFVGSNSLTPLLTQHIRQLADPSLVVAVEPAIAKSLNMALSVGVDTRFHKDDVIRAIRKKLFAQEGGLLHISLLGIGRPLFRSQLFEAVSSIEGVINITGVFVNDNSFDSYALSPGAGYYFNITEDTLTVSAS